jgi:hypothetical protein
MNDGQNHCFDAHHRVVCILRVLHEAGSFVLSMLWGVHTRNMSKHLRRNRSITHLAVGSLLAAGFLVAVMAPANASQVKSCGPGAIAVSGFEKNSEMTGENAVFVVLRNRSAVACSLQGSYPKALLYDAAGKRVPFLSKSGVGPYVSHKHPTMLAVPSGAKAFVMLAHYRCDIKITQYAHRLVLTLPGTAGRLSVTLPMWAVFDYCGAGDPDSTLYISRVGASITAV